MGDRAAQFRAAHSLRAVQMTKKFLGPKDYWLPSVGGLLKRTLPPFFPHPRPGQNKYVHSLTAQFSPEQKIYVALPVLFQCRHIHVPCGPHWSNSWPTAGNVLRQSTRLLLGRPKFTSHEMCSVYSIAPWLSPVLGNNDIGFAACTMGNLRTLSLKNKETNNTWCVV